MNTILYTPVLLILYNRLSTTQRVFDQIKKVRPRKLYIACDGFKNNKEGDQEKVSAVRQWVLSSIDWECQIETRFAEENQGCKYGPANAISWIFDNEEEAIILEDDIVADESFFWYCQDMLERYKNDTRIMLVSGHKGVWDFPIDEDYFFTAYNPIWGWATWRRAWERFDDKMKQWPHIKKDRTLKYIYGKNAAISLTDNFEATYIGKLDAWDYPWLFSQILNSGLAILPKYNLIENVGYGEDATHSEGKAPDFHVRPLELPLKPVENIIRNWEYDWAYSKQYLKPRKVRRVLRKFIPKSILRKWYQFRGVRM